MLTFTQFQTKYLGDCGVCSPAGAACGQCVGFWRRGVANICKGNAMYGIRSVEYAEEIFGAADPKKWIAIKNTDTNSPKEWDFVIWNGPGSRAGHVAIARKGCTKNNLYTLDQNYSKPRCVTKETHDYKNVIGWLRKR